ncbi:membrane protein [Actinomadura vinacea]|uniref:Membrane protein n=1 Tax=Actinomadura vinacea TaxID=115336 RepID=A0ABP5XPI3_9ACTN
MTKFLLSVHVLAAILAIGPIAVAASMFPAVARRAHAGADGAGTDDTVQGLAQLRLLHRICRVYAVFGLVVPVFGLSTALALDVLGDAWLIVSIVLTALAAGVLAFVLLPRQDALLAPAAPDEVARSAGRLAMHTGMFNLLWAIVTVLMIVRPGSTTGA